LYFSEPRSNNKIDKEVANNDRVFMEWWNLTLHIPIKKNTIGSGFKQSKYIKPLLRRWEEKMEEKMYNGLPKNQPKQIEGSR
jgi:hypothetical protein